EIRRRAKRAITIAFQDADVVAVEVGGGQVEVAVAVEIGGGDGRWPGANRDEAGAQERRVSTGAQEHRNPIVKVIGGRQIEPAILVEIAYHNVAGRKAQSGVDRSTECAIPVAWQNREACVKTLSQSNIEFAVASEIPKYRRAGPGAGGERLGCLECSVSIA